MRIIGRISLGMALLGVITLSACRYLLPERFAFNAPLASMIFGTGGPPLTSEGRARLKGPPGWSVSPFAEIPNARLIRFTEAGDLLISAPRSGTLWRVTADQDQDGRADEVTPLPLSLDRPHGLDLHGGFLYIGEGSRVVRVPFDLSTGAPTGEPEVIVDGLPNGGNHWTRTVAIGPDEKLYVAVGSSCNVCLEEDERRAAILRYSLDGSDYELFATGLRNPVDFAWQPGTGALYTTDNGRDLLGNDFPPCELNRVEQGGFYGWPYRNGHNVADPDFGGQRPDLESIATPPAHPFRAHNAPLGIGFADPTTAPEAYRDAAFVALHGSWNRTEKDGYKVVSLHWLPDGTIEERDFLTGFEQDDDVIGRPVDAAWGPDGALYVTDDYAGVVWRVAQGTSPLTSSVSRPASQTDATAMPSATAEQIAEGAQLYQTHACAGCHEAGEALEGVVPHPLRALGERYTQANLATFFLAPTPPMPRFDLDVKQREALAAYLLGR